MALIGDTIRLIAEFYNFDGILETPADVVVIIYDGNKKVIKTESVTAYEEGKFRYDYTIPEMAKPLFYEFAGTIGGLPIVSRTHLDITWLE